MLFQRENQKTVVLQVEVIGVSQQLIQRLLDLLVTGRLKGQVFVCREVEYKYYCT